MDTRRRQVEEVEGLQAVFGPAFEIANETQFAQLQSVLDGNDDCGDLVGIQIGFALIVSDNDGETLGKLRFTLPPEYPKVFPRLSLSTTKLTSAEQTEIIKSAETLAEDFQDTECLMAVYSAVQEDLISKVEAKEAAREEKEEGKEFVEDGFARHFLWFHHIKSPTKRRHIIEWAKELSLQGYSKPGYPGVVYIEGGAANCSEYVSRLRALRWKAMASRGELHEAKDGKGSQYGRFTHGFKELGEGDMGVLASYMETIGLKSFFMEAIMKVPS